jgi:hypothetical protein
MIGFVMVGTNNLDKATKFYDTLLNTIELKRVVTNEKYAGYALTKSLMMLNSTLPILSIKKKQLLEMEPRYLF